MSCNLRHRMAWLLVGLLCAGAVRVGAQDFWRRKPAEQWTLEEALALVRDSPWAHEEHVLMPHRADVPPRERRLERPGTGPGSPYPEPRLETSDWVSYLVRWESAGPVRQAFQRLQELGAGASATYQAQPPRVPDDRYVVTIKNTRPPESGLDPLAGIELEQWRQHARLKARRGEVAALEVEGSGVGANAAVHFFFPRTVEGAPLARQGEKVEFRIELRRLTLKSKFELDGRP